MEIVFNVNSERFHAKGNNYEWKVCTKANENNRQSVYECEKGCDAIEEQRKGVIWVLINKKLRIKDDNCNFVERVQENMSRILFEEEIKSHDNLWWLFWVIFITII